MCTDSKDDDHNDDDDDDRKEWDLSDDGEDDIWAMRMLMYMWEEFEFVQRMLELV
jgi:hypothetical protein